jgi:Zn-dependent peptidase ImmA (M78 family)
MEVNNKCDLAIDKKNEKNYEILKEISNMLVFYVNGIMVKIYYYIAILLSKYPVINVIFGILDK